MGPILTAPKPTRGEWYSSISDKSQQADNKPLSAVTACAAVSQAVQHVPRDRSFSAGPYVGCECTPPWPPVLHLCCSPVLGRC